ncbi:putative Transmembrane 7 superfamily member 2 protein, partial [Naja naja]
MDRLKVPRTKELEFGGVFGVALLMVGMPITVFYLLLVCRTEQASVLSVPWPLPSLRSLWSPQDFALVLAWVAFQALLYQLPMGKITEGSLLRDKSRLQYRLNGFYAMLITALMLGAGVVGGLRLSYIYDHILQLAFAASVLAFGLSVLLYFKAVLAPETALAPSGNSGLLGWAVINMAMLVKETELRGSPSLAMILVNAFQLLYMVDALWHEKNTFRRNPADPRVAATGRRLLVSGWWGFLRHPNYLGDLIMGFAWSLPCAPELRNYWLLQWFERRLSKEIKGMGEKTYWIWK